MAGQLNINLKINGVDQSISSINELESALTAAKTELKGLDVGSKAFNTLARDIQTAESKLKTVNKELEGLEPQQKAEGFVKLGEGIVGAFAVATTALSAFGVESEDVAEAQLKAQQLITVAIGARQIAEASLQIKIVATTIAQKAQTLATNASTAATRAFFTLVAANPIGALVTVLAAAAAAAYAFSQDVDDAAEAQKELNTSLADARVKAQEQIVPLRALQKIVNDLTEDENTRKQGLEDLKKLLPELEGLDLDRADALDIINQAIEDNIALTLAQTKTESLRQLVIKQTQKVLEESEKPLDDYITFWDELKNSFLSLGNPLNKIQRDIETGLTKSIEAGNKEQEKLNKFTKLYEDSLRDLLPEVSEYTSRVDRSSKSVENAKKLQEDIAKAYRLTVEELSKLRDIQVSAAPEPKVIQDLQARLSELRTLIQTAFPPDVIEEFNKQFGSTLIITDEFGENFIKEIRKIPLALKEGNTDIEALAKNAEDTFFKIFREGKISEEALKSGLEVVNGYREFAKELTKGKLPIEEFFNVEAFNRVLEIYLGAQGKLQAAVKVVGGDIEAVPRDFTDAFSSAEATLNTFTTTVTTRYSKALQDAGFSAEDAAKIAENTVKNLFNFATAIVDTEQDVRGFFKTATELQKQIQGLDDDAKKAFLINNKEAFAEYAYTQGLRIDLDERYFNDKERQEENAFLVETFYANLGVDYLSLTNEQKKELLDAYYEYAKQKRDEDTTDTKNSYAEVAGALADNFRQIAQVAQTGVEVFRQYLEVQLEALNQAEEKAIEGLTGTEEEQARKRIQIQEDYEERRKELTKKGQIAQLRLTQASALANVADAITKALAAGPVIGQILAGITAAIGLAQVAVIQSQISQVQSFARGGLLFGPSHQQGGITLSNGAEVEGGEAIITRNSTQLYRGLLSQINQSTGGAPIISTPYDDSRLIEALNNVNRTVPLRAYVVERDITTSQEVNARLNQLSKF